VSRNPIEPVLSAHSRTALAVFIEGIGLLDSLGELPLFFQQCIGRNPSFVLLFRDGMNGREGEEKRPPKDERSYNKLPSCTLHVNRLETPHIGFVTSYCTLK
jgi:hypothetical protein